MPWFLSYTLLLFDRLLEKLTHTEAENQARTMEKSTQNTEAYSADTQTGY